MREKFRSRGFKTLLSLALVFALVLSPVSSLAAYYLRCVYEHDSADPAWLRELTIRENVYTTDDLSNVCVLTAVPEYPYTATPESFEKTVNYFVELYSIDGTGLKAAYIYLFTVLNKFATVETANATDEEVREYLTDKGFVFPAADGGETIIIARALYYAYIKGVATQYATFYEGEPIGAALIAFAAGVAGYDVSELVRWIPNGDITDLKQYAFAVCKAALYNEGYDVDENTSEVEVGIMTAEMVASKAGFMIDSGMDYEGLKTAFLAAMLGSVYSVSVERSSLAEALADGRTAVYILALIGKEHGVTVGADSTLDSAFNTVAENTDYFSFDYGEFWADVYSYRISLSNRRESLWFYPICMNNSTNDPGCIVTLDVNGVPVEDSKYTQVPIDPELDTQLLVLTVDYVKGGVTSTCVYRITVDQSSAGELITVDPEEAGLPDNNTVASIVTGIVEAAALRRPEIAFYASAAGINLPQRVSDITALLIPDFTGGGIELDEEKKAQVLDSLAQLGAAADSVLSGVGGYTEFMETSSLDETVMGLLNATLE
ncbi:MAG: hypothetical protein K6C36_05790 [Clostridia bacterium]|nr:hypothetical protein [Clostridia bacterium]